MVTRRHRRQLPEKRERIFDVLDHVDYKQQVE
jgi:hypothetical protein